MEAALAQAKRYGEQIGYLDVIRGRERDASYLATAFAAFLRQFEGEDLDALRSVFYRAYWGY